MMTIPDQGSPDPAKVQCIVYKRRRKAGTYLFIETRAALDGMDARDVLARLPEDGFYLQLTPSVSEQSVT